MSDVVKHFKLARLSAYSLSNEKTLTDFLPGVSDQEIAGCESTNNWDFPSELKELLSFANGENRENDPLLFTYSSFCSLEQMSAVNQDFLDNEPNLFNHEESEREMVRDNPFIPENSRWQRYWIPLASAVDNATVLFLDPNPIGSIKSSIFWFTEDTCCGAPIALSLSELFEKINEYILEHRQIPSFIDLKACEFPSHG